MGGGGERLFRSVSSTTVRSKVPGGLRSVRMGRLVGVPAVLCYRA